MPLGTALSTSFKGLIGNLAYHQLDFMGDCLKDTTIAIR